MESRDQLRRFAHDGDEEAFASVVQAHLDLVYNVASRHVNDHHLAEEVCQRVFQILARKASRLTRHPALHAWLFRTTLYEASKARRSESLRQRKHQEWKQEHRTVTQETCPMNDDSQISEARLQQLDEGLNALDKKDRELLLRRFFADQSLRAIGDDLKISENASQKRVARALTKLEKWMSRRGVAISATALMAGLSAGTSKAAPSSLASNIVAETLAAPTQIAAVAPWCLAFNVKSALMVGTVGFALPWGGEWLGWRAGDSSQEMLVETSGRRSLVSTNSTNDPVYGEVIDPAERVRLILALEDREQRFLELGYLVRRLSGSDIPRALAVLTQSDPEDRVHLEVFIEHWSRRSPKDALAFIESRLPAFREAYLKELMKGWVGRSPQDAWSHVASLSDDVPHRALLFDLWIQERSFTVPADALTKLLTQTERIQSYHLRQVFKHWPQESRVSAFEAIGRLANEEWASEALKAFGSQFGAPLDSAFFDDLNQSLPDAMRRPIGTELLGRWLAKEPAAARAYMESQGDAPPAAELARIATDEAWKGGDYEGLLPFFQAQADDLFAPFFSSWFAMDGKGALNAFPNLLPSQKHAVAKDLGMYLAQRAPDTVYEQGQALPDAESRRVYYGASVSRLAELDFPLALSLLEQLDDPAILDAAFPAVAKAYADSEPEAALLWAMEAAPPKKLPDIVQKTVRAWAKEAPSAALAWHETQTDPVIIDHSAAAMAVAAMGTSGSTALAWAQTIEDPQLRQEALTNVTADWAKHEATSFVPWFRTQPESMQRALLASDPDWHDLIDSGS